MQEKTYFDKTTGKGWQHRKNWMLVVLLAGMLATGGCYLFSNGNKTEEALLEEAILESEISVQETQEQQQEEGEAVTTENVGQEPLCYVHVCGEVVKPGVYELKAGARVYDAVELAGGLTEDAVEEAVNLAETVVDGQQIRIPDRQQAGSMDVSIQAESEGKVNLNTATEEQLMTLSGVGSSRARDIIAYREEHGPFFVIEDVMKVPGIKEAAFAKIKEDITVQ